MILSNIKRVRKEDIPESPEWANKIISPLNIFIDTVYSAFQRKITFGDNIQAFFKEIEISSVPFTISNELNDKPKAVFVAQLYKKTDPGATLGHGIACEWDLTNDGIRIKYIDGITSGTAYFCRLLVI